MNSPSIYQYVKTEEGKFESDEIQVGENWFWNLRNHVQLIFHLKNGMFYTGTNNYMRAFKNIMEPLLNLAYWTEDLEVKDVTFFIEQSNGRALSFLIKKYHDEVFVRQHDLDTLFDEITESDLDYGGVLVQQTDTPRPEILHLNSIAFCDQTDILGGPIAFKHYFSPGKLRSMSKAGWGDKKNGATISLEELCLLASQEKQPAGTLSEKTNRVPGKTIEVYIVRGNLPEHYLKDNDDMEYHSSQLHIIAFYTDKDHKQHGVTLYRQEEDEGTVKFFTSKKVFGRALGRGVGESLLHPQIWTNFLTIHKTQMLESAAKVPLMTDDPAFTNKNKIQDMENLEVTVVSPDTKIPPQPIQTAAVNNIQLYEASINEWFEHGQLTGAAFDPILGKEQSSGTTFRGQERTVAQGRGLHDRRRGQRAKFLEMLYRDWIIPDIVREIVKGKKFLATLTPEELGWIAEQLAENAANQAQKRSVIDGQLPEEKEILKQVFKERFSKKGTRHLIEILKDEFKDIEIKMGINIAGKQKDLAVLSDKLLNVFQFIFANPQGFQQAMQIPALAKSFQDILEFSGMNQVDFLSLTTPQPLAQALPQAIPQPEQQPMKLNQPAAE